MVRMVGYENLLDPKIQKPSRSERYSNLLDENRTPKDTKTILDPKIGGGKNSGPKWREEKY